MEKVHRYIVEATALILLVISCMFFIVQELKGHGFLKVSQPYAREVAASQLDLGPQVIMADELTEREQYLIDALYAIDSFGKGTPPREVLRPYMDKHGIKWDKNDDVKTWMQRIAQDAIDHANKR